MRVPLLKWLLNRTFFLAALLAVLFFGWVGWKDKRRGRSSCAFAHGVTRCTKAVRSNPLGISLRNGSIQLLVQFYRILIRILLEFHCNSVEMLLSNWAPQPFSWLGCPEFPRMDVGTIFLCNNVGAIFCAIMLHALMPNACASVSSNSISKEFRSTPRYGCHTPERREEFFQQMHLSYYCFLN